MTKAEGGACFKQIDEFNCDVCVMQEKHLIRADVSGKMDRKDVENNKGPSKGYYPMDQQKIIMLPHMPVKKGGPLHQTNIDDQSNDCTPRREKPR